MPSLTLDNRLIWFAHCPKAGGTSVERFLVDCHGDAVGHLHWGWDLWWARGGWREADPPNSPQHLIWRDALDALEKLPDAAFALVRDPVARMISEYRYQRSTRRGTRAGSLLARLPFSLWLRLMLRLARENPYAFDNHLRPQSDFVPTWAEVFRLEDGLEPVGAWLAAHAECHGFSAAMPRVLESGGITPRIDPRDRTLIARAFSTDYARFGYVLPPPGPDTRPLVDLVARALLHAVWLMEQRGCL